MARLKLSQFELPPLALIPVDSNSLVAWHAFVHACAVAFKREFGYDIIQWTKPRGQSREDEGFAEVFTDEKGMPVGAVAFRWRRYQNAPSRWGLQWIWFQPEVRRKGLLARHWTTLRERYGDFDVETPVSDAMKAFLLRHGDADLGHPATNLGENFGVFTLHQWKPSRGFSNPLYREPELTTPKFPRKGKGG